MTARLLVGAAYGLAAWLTAGGLLVLACASVRARDNARVRAVRREREAQRVALCIVAARIEAERTDFDAELAALTGGEG